MENEGMNNKQEVVQNEVPIQDNNGLGDLSNNWVEPSNKKSFKKIILSKNTKRVLIVVGAIIGLILIICVVNNIVDYVTRDARKINNLTNIKSDKMVFNIGDDEFTVGCKYNDLKNKQYTFDTTYINEDNIIGYDMIYIQNIYKDGKAVLLGLFYCSNKDGCKYEDTTLVKALFYKNSKIKIGDNISFSSSYDDFLDEFGKPEGVYKQDKSYYIWCFGDDHKIGDAYYMVKFNGGSHAIIDIRIGVWWYDDEYNRTVVKENN